MTSWSTGTDLAEEIAPLDIGCYYRALSWHCLLAGHGTFPADEKLTASFDGLALSQMTQIDRFVAGCAMNFGSHKAALANLSA